MPEAAASTLTAPQTAALARTTDGSVWLFLREDAFGITAALLRPAAVARMTNMVIGLLTRSIRSEGAPVTNEDLRALATAVEASTTLAQKQVLADALRTAATRGALSPRAFAAIAYIASQNAATQTAATPRPLAGPELVGVNEETTFPDLPIVATGPATVGAPVAFTTLPEGNNIISALGTPLGNTETKMVWPWWTVWAIGGGALLVAIAIGIAIWAAARKKREARAELEAPGRAIGQLPRGSTITVSRR